MQQFQTAQSLIAKSGQSPSKNVELQQAKDGPKSAFRGSYFNTLPDDLLHDIFQSALLDFKSGMVPVELDIPIQYILCTVCRRWRELIIGSPLLWTDIYFPSNPPFENLVFFERSAPALVNVTFTSVSQWNSSEMQTHHHASEVMKKYISRLRNFTICVMDSHELTPLLHAWRTSEAPNFSRLDISCMSDYYEFNETVLSSEATRNLRTVKLHGFPLRGLPSLPLLTSLEVDSINPNPRHFRALFQKCPLLETLIIRRLGTPWDHDSKSELAQVDAPSLISCAINVDSDHDLACACVLPQLSTPNLQYLEISSLCPVITDHHTSITARFKHLPNLRRLRIQSDSLWLGDISSISSLPKTTDLEIVGFPKDQATTLLFVLNLTNLRSIHLDLIPPKSHHSNHLLDLATLHDIISAKPPLLRCPTHIHCEDSDSRILGKLKKALGPRLDVRSTPLHTGLLHDYLRLQVFDDHEDFFDRFMDGSVSDGYEEDLPDEDFDEYYDHEYEPEPDPWEDEEEDYEEDPLEMDA